MSNTSSNDWPAQTRRSVIAALLSRDNQIKRKTVADLLGMSQAQISADIQRMVEIAPGFISYDLSQKCYLLAKPKALEKFPPPDWMQIHL